MVNGLAAGAGATRVAPRRWAGERAARRPLLVGIALAVALAWVVFSPSLRAGYVSYDDEHYIVRNRLVVRGALADVARILSGPVNGEYLPVRLLSHLLDRKLFADHAFGGHLVNLVFHSLNVALVFLLARRTGASARAAAVAGLVFAVHPLAVESVAWISERKGLICAFSLLLSLLAFQSALERTARAAVFPCVVSLLLFVVALGAKSTGLPFPAILALETARRRVPLARAARLVAPFLVVAVVCAGLQFRLSQRSEIVKEQATTPLAQARTIGAVYAHYAAKLVWPRPLQLRYGLDWAAPALEPRDLGSALAALLVLGPPLLLARRGRPGALLLVAAGVALLVPVSGVVRISQLVTDRYAYLPLVAFAIGVGRVAGDLARARRAPATFALALALGAAAALSSARVRDWSSSEALFAHDVSVTGEARLGELELGKLALRDGKLDEALEHANAAVVVDPNGLERFKLLYAIASRKGEGAEMERVLEALAAAHPENASWVAVQRIEELLSAGEVERAEGVLRAALAKTPADAELARAAGHVEVRRGRLDAAERAYAKAAELEAGPTPCLDLANLRLERGDLAGALAAADEAERRDVSDWKVPRDRGLVLSRMGRDDEARSELETALAIEPGDFRASFRLAELLARRGEQGRAEAVLLAARAEGDEEEGDRLLALAKVQALRGETASARETLARAIGKRAASEAWARKDPVLSPLFPER